MPVNLPFTQKEADKSSRFWAAEPLQFGQLSVVCPESSLPTRLEFSGCGGSFSKAACQPVLETL